MKRMKTIITVRLPREDVEAISAISVRSKKGKSTTLRELVGLGKIYFAITEYREGRVSIGRAAELSGLSISEMFDLLSKMGIQGSMELEDYLEGRKFAAKLVSGQ